MDVITLGFSCLNIFLYCFPLIVNILFTIWKCVSSVLPTDSPFDILFLFYLPSETELDLTHFEMLKTYEEAFKNLMEIHTVENLHVEFKMPAPKQTYLLVPLFCEVSEVPSFWQPWSAPRFKPSHSVGCVRSCPPTVNHQRAVSTFALPSGSGVIVSLHLKCSTGLLETDDKFFFKSHMNVQCLAISCF